MTIPGELVIGAVGMSAIRTKAVQNLLSPITQKLGELGGDLGGIARFYARDNLEKVFTKWAHQRDDRPLPPDTDFSKLLPIIQHAQFQSDDDLQESFAALLESTVTDLSGVLPSFQSLFRS